MKAGFIGAGKVGFTLGKYLTINGTELSGYYSRHESSAEEAARFTSSKVYHNLKKLIEDSDILFITVSDGAIDEVYREISQFPIENKYICHCSGSISSAAFFDAENRGAFRYSIHPLMAVSDKFNSYKDMDKAYFSIEGTEEHIDVMKNLIESCGNRVAIIDSSKKTLYHGAAVMVSNQMIALASIGTRLLVECGFEKERAEKALAPLILGNIEKLAEAGPSAALTGPVERCDTGTVKKHLECLEGDIEEIYRLLSKELITIAKEKHTDRDYTELEKIVDEEKNKDEKHSCNI